MHTIPANEHAFVSGQTQTGKTFLTRQYLSGYENVVAIDTKGLISWPEIPGTKWTGDKNHILTNGGKELTMVHKLADLPLVKTPKIIYRPSLDEMFEDYYDSFFQWCYMRKNTVVWVDEAMSITPNPSRIPYWYKAILTRGMERNTSVWSLSQRPSGIAQVVMSEAMHFFIFRLNMPQDREKLADTTGCKEFEDRPDKLPNGQQDSHVFWYWNVTQENATRAKLKVS